MSKKIAVILSGCGFMDGAEIREAVLTLYAIEKNGATFQCFAPDMEQYKVDNHLSGKTVGGEKRNVLVESARIARGDIKPLSDYNEADFDALMLPGGFGTGFNLTNFAVKGPDCDVNEDTEKAIKSTHDAGKPIGAICFAPAVVARVLGDGVEVTIGTDEGTGEAVEKTGAKHINVESGGIHVDSSKKVVTSPCYMLTPTILEVEREADSVIKEVLKMA